MTRDSGGGVFGTVVAAVDDMKITLSTILVLVGTPGLVAAQQPEPAQLHEPSDLMVDDSTEQRADRRPRRIIAEVGGGILGEVLSVGLSWGAGALATAGCSEDDEESCMGRYFAAGITSYALASPLITSLGVWSMGNAVDGQGAYGWTLLGSTLGAGAGSLVFLGSAVHEAFVWTGMALVPALSIVGATIAYERSHRSRQSVASESWQRARLAPVAGADHTGLTLGLAGVF